MFLKYYLVEFKSQFFLYFDRSLGQRSNYSQANKKTRLLLESNPLPFDYLNRRFTAAKKFLILIQLKLKKIFMWGFLDARKLC